MKSLYTLSVIALSVLPGVAAAQGLVNSASGSQLEALLRNILTFVNGVVIPFIIGIGFLFFVWGMFRYFIVGGANDESKEKGKSVMIYATLGFVMIIIFWGVVNLVATSIGLEGEAPPIIPTVTVGAKG